jgi:hypothetical protein
MPQVPQAPRGSSPNVEVIAWDEVPDPPQHPFTGVRTPPQPQVVTEDSPRRHLGRVEAAPEPSLEKERFTIDDVDDGWYFVVIDGEIAYASSDLETLEAHVEFLIFDAEDRINLDDITVLRKMKIKVGVNIG